jgi:hypothetical protein
MSKVLPVQSLTTPTTTLVLVLFMRFLQKQHKDPMDLMRMSKTVLWSYVYTDFFTWLQHAYLDLESNRTSSIPFIREYAQQFQLHHDDPGLVCKPGAGLRAIDGLVQAISITGLLASTANSTDDCAFTLCTIAYGIVAIYNHVLCHAESRDYAVPAWIHALQRACILPDTTFHQTHHRPDRPDAHHLNWSFLMGPSRLLEKCYKRLEEPEWLLTVLFTTCNPVMVSVYQSLYHRTGI